VSSLTLGSVVLVAAIPHHPAGVPPLYAAGIAAKPCAPHDVIVVPAGSRQRYYLSSNVLDTAPVTACQQAAVSADRQWLSAGIIPGGSPQVTSMATRALLDLHLSTRPDGAVIAGWHNRWEYSWPRDSSWAAVALAYTGHAGDSLRVLRFLQQMQLKSGTWAARYWPDGSGPVDDGRPAELDANGWVPWAVWCWSVEESHESESAEPQLARLWPMVEAAADAAVRSLSPDDLPAASMDYWESSVQVTLSTAAALLTGLRAAADIAGELGHETSAAQWARAASRLADGITAGFGRYGAETAFFALSDAETGHRQQASQLLTWFATHTTRLGTLPEKVDARGQPVSAAPLAWTDAAVLLTLVAQAHRLPVVPIPGG
jgi:GH15 family glucan-1,4-alpha-glucosidase